MKKWHGMMTQLGGGRLPEFGDDLFSWFDLNIVVLDDYVYAREDFRGDSNMVFPNGKDFDDDLGKFFGYIFFCGF